MSLFHDFKNHITKSEEVNFIVGERIRSARQLRGMTQKEAAEKLGISKSQLGRMENNHIEVPQGLIFKLMNTFELGKKYFYTIRWERV